jgi:propane monooxygenase small subunit
MTTEPHQRDLPKPEFTDAEAGRASSRLERSTVQLLHTAEAQAVALRGRHVEVQPDPRHYLRSGLAIWLLRWPGRVPTGLDCAQGVGFRPAGAGALSQVQVGAAYDWPATGWHEFRDPERGVGADALPYNANVVRQINANIDTARETRRSSSGTATG